MTNIKDIKTNISDIQAHLELLAFEFFTARKNIDSVLNRLNDLEPAFDPAKEYTFQEAAMLAFENPGWVFRRRDKMYTADHDVKHKGLEDQFFLDGYNDKRQFSPKDFLNTWRRIK